mgnify:CR=1 FL=1
MERTLERGAYRVVLTDETNEGVDGTYNPNIPGDYVHLRYYVDVASEDPNLCGWDGVESASYCTLIPANVREEVLDAALVKIADTLFPLLAASAPYKRAAEALSWLDEDSFK